jgi:hypothetical protein
LESPSTCGRLSIAQIAVAAAHRDFDVAHDKAVQMPDAKAKLGGVFNMGGAAVANYVSILEPLR